MRHNISRFLNGFFILAIALFVLDTLPTFDIKSQTIKSFSYVGILILTPLSFVWNLWHFKKTKWKILNLAIPFLTLIGILIIGPINILFSSESWKTQKIIYQNNYSDFNKVEFQMQNIGALGYNKRIVEVTYLTNLFMIVCPVKKDIDESLEWVKVNKEVNELGQKSP